MNAERRGSVGEAAGAIERLEHAVDRHGEVRDRRARPSLRRRPARSRPLPPSPRPWRGTTPRARDACRTGPSTTARTSRIASLASRRFDVENAIICSPLPFEAWEPAAASPRPARRAMRASWCGSRGASVATTTTHEPSWCSPASGRSAPAHRHAVDPQLLAIAVVREHERADREPRRRRRARATPCRSHP